MATTTGKEPGLAPRKGRRPDAGLEARALAAALDVYGETGWSGFTMDLVASRAHIGKSSLYRRWTNKSEFLVQALRLLVPGLDIPAAADHMTVRQVLIDHATRRAEVYLGPRGNALYHLLVDARTYPDELAEIVDLVLGQPLRAEQHLIQHAIDDGRLAGVSRVHLLDAVEGMVLFHVLITPDRLRDRLVQELPTYIERLVDIHLSVGTATASDYESSERAAARWVPHFDSNAGP